MSPHRRLQLFFDLDGTLTDSAIGIAACIQAALSRLGQREPQTDEIRPFIGSPLRAIFESFLSEEREGGNEESRELSPEAIAPQVDRAIDFYRERFDAKGFAENSLYPGVREGLEHLRGEDHGLFIVTAKRPEDALRVARHFEFDGFFAGVFGAENDAERGDKTPILARALKSAGATPADSIMIGDRSHDMSAAKGNRVTPLGAGWGYGSSGELRSAGARHIAESPGEMVEWLAQRARRVQ